MNDDKKKVNKNLKISWLEFQDACNKLAAMVAKENMNDAVMLAIANGGLFVAGILGRIFKNDNIGVIGTKRQQNEKSSYGEFEIRLTSCLTCAKNMVFKINKKILLVDDIYDSGSTVKFIKSMFEVYPKPASMMYATPYYKASKFLVKNSKEVSKNLISPFQIDPSYWIQYPWEKTEENE